MRMHKIVTVLAGLAVLLFLSPALVAEPPISAETVDLYLHGKDSPLATRGPIFVSSGSEWSVDPRLVVAIAGAETTFGKRVCTDFNAWNWFWDGPCPASPFLSWDEGIETVSKRLRISYFNRYNLTTIPLIQTRYCTAGCENWIPLVTQFYHDELGGDLNDLTFSGRESNAHAMLLSRSAAQYATIPDSDQAGLDLAGDFTIEAWVKPASNIPPGQEYVLVSKWSSRVSEKTYLFAYYHDGASPTLAASIAPSPFADSRDVKVPYTLPVGIWSHVAMVFTAVQGKVEFFVNGASIGFVAGLASTVNTSSSPLQIGTRQGFSATAFDGRLDEVRIWNVARTRGEIQENYGRTLSGSESGLVGYWQFECDATDKTENNNDLSLINGASFVADSPFGESGEACQ